jgi:hypothetical protein
MQSPRYTVCFGDAALAELCAACSQSLLGAMRAELVRLADGVEPLCVARWPAEIGSVRGS